LSSFSPPWVGPLLRIGKGRFPSFGVLVKIGLGGFPFPHYVIFFSTGVLCSSLGILFFLFPYSSRLSVQLLRESFTILYPRSPGFTLALFPLPNLWAFRPEMKFPPISFLFPFYSMCPLSAASHSSLAMLLCLWLFDESPSLNENSDNPFLVVWAPPPPTLSTFTH